MKYPIGATIAIALVVVVSFVGCDLALEPVSTDLVDNDAPSLVLPDDVVSDVARSVSGSSFQTYVTVDVALDVNVVRPPASDDRSLEQGFLPTVVATIADPAGNVLFRALANADGEVVGSFGVPTATEQVMLTISGTGIVPVERTIDDPVTIARIERSIAVAADSTDPRSRALASPPDSDLDGVPDSYDAYPNNPDLAFSESHPPQGQFTIGYEDNFPNVGDADFNDFLANISFVERLASTGKTDTIVGQATARARAAGYDHEFGVYIEMPGAVASLYVEVRNADGRLLSSSSTTVRDAARIVLFDFTKQAFDRSSDQVTQDNPAQDRQTSDGHSALFILDIDPTQSTEDYEVAPSPYDPYLFVHNTGYDVHLIGQSSLPGLNEDDPDVIAANENGFVDANGFPRGLLVPVEWAHPVEPSYMRDGTYSFPYVEFAYPQFADWRADLEQGTLNGEHNDWYLTPNAEYVVVPPAE